MKHSPLILTFITLVILRCSLLLAQSDTIQFNPKHGFFFSPFNLEIMSANAGSKIYYTTDGSVPDITNGKLYTGPVNISTTAVIRAVGVNNNQFRSRIATQTYIFPYDVIHQPENPEGYPSERIMLRFFLLIMYLFSGGL